MSKLSEKLWNWGHLAGSHNELCGVDCKMSPVDFANEYGVKNSFIVSYGGNIVPPFKSTAQSLEGLDKIIWSVLGDSSTPLPEDELGNTKDIIEVLPNAKNIVGGVVDDFFSPARMERFTPEVLKKIKAELNKNGLSFWCVLYNNQLELDLEKYMDCFDGVTFWIWESANIPNMDEYFDKLKKITKEKPLMLGMYVFDYCAEGGIMKPELFEMQIKRYFELLVKKEIEGVIFCSNTLGDMPLATNSILKRYVKQFGDTEI